MVKPILLAVPSIIFIAPSISKAFKSGIFNSAISLILLREILPIRSILGLLDPFLSLAAFIKRTDAGGVLVIKLNERSAYTVIITGMIVSPCCWVLALKALQNSIILTPCCPSAGPTGGEGLAPPAGICNFIYP